MHLIEKQLTKAIPFHGHLPVNSVSRLIPINCAIDIIINLTMMIVMKGIIIATITIIITNIIIDLIVVIIMIGNPDHGCSSLHKGLKAIEWAHPC